MVEVNRAALYTACRNRTCALIVCAHSVNTLHVSQAPTSYLRSVGFAVPRVTFRESQSLTALGIATSNRRAAQACCRHLLSKCIAQQC